MTPEAMVRQPLRKHACKAAHAMYLVQLNPVRPVLLRTFSYDSLPEVIQQRQ